VVAPFTSRLIHEWASVRLRCELVSVQHQQQQPAVSVRQQPVASVRQQPVASVRQQPVASVRQQQVASVAAMARLEEEAAALLGTR
jgi:hypothetical protein